MAQEGEELLSMEDAAKMLDVSVATLYRWIREGRLPAVKANPARRRQKEPLRFKRADVLALLGKGGE